MQKSNFVLLMIIFKVLTLCWENIIILRLKHTPMCICENRISYLLMLLLLLSARLEPKLKVCIFLIDYEWITICVFI